jgi:hypothetical protein
MEKSPQYSSPKIQMVANELRKREDYKSHYVPKVVSMGPIHHGKPELQIGEQYKLIWAKKFIETSNLTSKDLYKKVADKLAVLKSHFAADVLKASSNTDLKSFGSFEEKLTWMLFVDGCSLLYILDIHNDFGTEERIMKLVSRDVLLLENQLPYMLLDLLSWDSHIWSILASRIIDFLEFHHMASSEYKYWGDHGDPTHLLDYLRKRLLTPGDPNHKFGSEVYLRN